MGGNSGLQPPARANRGPLALLLVGVGCCSQVVLGLGCAGTVARPPEAEMPWRQEDGYADRLTLRREDLPVRAYVVELGISAAVLAAYPGLVEPQVGFGVAERVVEALYGSGLFRLVEEKADVTERVQEQLARGAGGATGQENTDAPAAAVAYLVYGEIVDVVTQRAETVTGISGGVRLATRVRIQVRIVERSSGRAGAAMGMGEVDLELGASAAAALQRLGGLDPGSVAGATGAAVEQAVSTLRRAVIAP
ncbi:MAG: hypothetical protein HYV63_10815 [Candidatus Schekmanbacteria bacterium]|nr:hypothetical protein [Candidatus Schekmanbacteria bacterium]